MAWDWNLIEKGTAAAESAVTAAAILAGGFWTYRRFIRQQEDFPHIQFAVDVNFVGVQDGSWLLEVVALVENKGKVRHTVKKFDFDLRYLKPGDPVKLGDE